MSATQKPRVESSKVLAGNRFKGWLVAITAFIACPCHFPITLPVLLGLTAGTTVGVWIGQNTVLIYALSTAYFLGALAVGLRWLRIV